MTVIFPLSTTEEWVSKLKENCPSGQRSKFVCQAVLEKIDEIGRKKELEIKTMNWLKLKVIPELDKILKKHDWRDLMNLQKDSKLKSVVIKKLEGLGIAITDGELNTAIGVMMIDRP